MLSTSSAPSPTMCRICAFDSDDTEPLFDDDDAPHRRSSEAGHMFTTCLAIELQPPPDVDASMAAAADAVYPRRICFRCNTQLRMFYEFRRGALRMHQRFTEQVQKRLVVAAAAEAEADATSQKRRRPAETAAVVPIELISVHNPEQNVSIESHIFAAGPIAMESKSVASGDGENELLDEDGVVVPVPLEPETIGEHDEHGNVESDGSPDLPDVDDVERVLTSVKEEATGENEETAVVVTDEDEAESGEGSDGGDGGDVEHMDVTYLEDDEMLFEGENDHDVDYTEQHAARVNDHDEDEDEEEDDEDDENDVGVYKDEYVPASLAVERLVERKGCASKAVAMPKTTQETEARQLLAGRAATGKKGTPCADCGKTFKRYSNLQKHVCQEETIFACEQCGVEFPTKQRRDMHASRHTTHRPVPCEFCDKSFKNKYDLKVHHRSHSDLRKYVCPICGNAFRARTHLNNHVESHALENNYPCKFCNQKYKTQITLTRHMVSMHTNKDEFQCAECGKAFGLKFRYERHLKIHQRQRQQRRAVQVVELVENTTEAVVMEAEAEAAEAEVVFELREEHPVVEEEQMAEQPPGTVKFKVEEECWVEEGGRQYEVIQM